MFFVAAVWLLAATSTPQPLLVDDGVTELRICRIKALAFRTPNDGWMSDNCGGIFRSRDGGRSWSPDESTRYHFFGAPKQDAHGLRIGVDEVQEMLWFDEHRGLVFLYGSPTAFRTEDGGRTWAKVELPSPAPEHKHPYVETEMIYGLDHVGDRVWYCGSSGRVTRSLDGGKTWLRGRQQLFEAAGINPTNWCSGISFVDAQDGWAMGWHSLWGTHDGGATWTALPPVLESKAARQPVVGDSEEIRGVFRLNRSVAWAYSREKVHRTRNGGKTWSEVPEPALAPDTVDLGDHHLLAVTKVAAAGDEDFVPLDRDRWFVVAPHQVINADLDLFRKGALVRRGPPVTPPSGHTVPLEGTTDAGKWRWGWSGASVFASQDGGKSWFRIGKLEKPIARLVALNSEVLLAKGGDALYRSEDQGREWKDATSELSAQADWSRIAGQSRGPAGDDAVTCALAAPSSVTLTFGGYGCFGGETNAAKLEVASDGSSRLTGRWTEWDRDAKREVSRNVDAHLSAHDTRSWVQRMNEAASRPEGASECWSTGHTTATLSWRCGTSAERKLSFEAMDCPRMEETDAGTITLVKDPNEPYHRAKGLNSLAEQLLKSHEAR